MKLKLLMALSSLIISFAASEMLLRLFELKAQNIPLNQKIFVHSDPEFGWYGEKNFGSIEKKSYKIFITGDSFTQGNGVIDENRYYSVLRQGLDFELFVYAAPGYSTTQEYLVIKKYIREIQPDLIIIQLCNNDPINNDISLEIRSLLHNNHQLRPYLIDNKIKFLFPSHFGGLTYFMVKHSRLALRTMIIMDVMLRNLRDREFITSVEEHIGESQYSKLYENAEKTTKQLMGLIRNETGKIPIVFLPVDTYKELNAMLRTELPNSYWIDSPAKLLDELKAQGAPVVQQDGGHWNEQGHKIAGTMLLEELIARKIVPEEIIKTNISLSLQDENAMLGVDPSSIH